ncbi:MAG TPA: bifunctional riboflavin kinase/FAD synthetase [Rubricoccaceae bacterium]
MTREADLVRDDRSVVTTGTFDGVHLGHQAIVTYLVGRAHAVGGVPTVVTFSPHPREVITGTPVPLLTTLDERADHLESLGVERFVVLPFSRALSQLSAEAYVSDVLLGQIGMREIVVGYDHRFGRGREGDRATLERIGAQRGFTVDVIPEQIYGAGEGVAGDGPAQGITISSSEIRRRLIDDGDAAGAAHLLGRPYRLSGPVVRGDQRGRTIGFPTANVQPANPSKLLPRTGVYAVRATLPGGETRGGMMNVGVRPTFQTDGRRTVEVHLFDVEADLYGQTLGVDLVARLRDERRFEGIEALVAQLREDESEARNALAG